MAGAAKGIFIVGAKRTPFGTFGGVFKNTTATELQTLAITAAMKESGVKPEQIDTVVVGQVMSASQPDGIYVPRHAALKAGIPQDRPALGINRLCGSGFQSVVNSAQDIMTGSAKISVAGGVENMSQAPFAVRGVRFGTALGSSYAFEDTLWAGLSDSYCGLPMGMTAEKLGGQFGVTRDEVDNFALRSQQLWKKANDAGVFKAEIEPVKLTIKRKEVTVATDEHPRPQTTLEGLKKLPPVFKKEGLVTAGTASGISDGAGALILASEEAAKNLKPLARLVAWASVGVDPSIMGVGPVPAIQAVLKTSGLSLNDIDIIEEAAKNLKPLARLVAWASVGVDPSIMGVGPVPAIQAVLKTSGLSLNDIDIIEVRFNSGAELKVSTTREEAAKNLKPLAWLVAWASVGVDPSIMGVGPVPAIQAVLKTSGLSLNDIDIIEVRFHSGAELRISATREEAAKNLKPLARLVAWASVGVDPSIMGVGPVPAIQAVLKTSGLSLNDIDIIESFQPSTATSMPLTWLCNDRRLNDHSLLCAHPKHGTILLFGHSGAEPRVSATREEAAKNLKPLARLVAWASVGVDPSIMGVGPVPAIQAVLKTSGLSLNDIDIIEVRFCSVLTTCEEAAKNLKPLARLVAWASVGVDPSIMGVGPVPAIQAVLKTSGLSLNDIDIIEVSATCEEATKNLKPLARLVAWASVGVDPSIMGVGPVPAIQAVLKTSGLSLNDIDIIEINEAFCAQTLACAKALKLDMEKLNPNGGATALGHPLAASGSRITAHLVHELKRRGLKRAIGSACIGGGQGIALLIEAV
ncbi:acetyl-CoA acetyltransferase [Phthorimaea operculella]|nr:acetyl-CoA acetyltransferase [Phthorimaea operculella]